MIFYDNEDLNNYLEWRKAIKEDLNRCLIILENYENNEDLINVIKNIINNIENDYSDYGPVPRGFIDIHDDYFKFNYIVYDENYERFNNNVVMITRDYKDIYVDEVFYGLCHVCHSYSLIDNEVSKRQISLIHFEDYFIETIIKSKKMSANKIKKKNYKE